MPANIRRDRLFKIVTGSAALEEKKVTPDELIFDSGRHWLVDMRNAGGEALGWINFKRALSASDNVYFYEMGNRLGIDLLDQYAEKFGFGKKTGIDLHGEASGLIATPAYKKKVFEDEWYLGDTFNTAIGQGFTLATPMQVAEMLAAVATDGKRYKPHLVSKIINDDGSVAERFEPQEEGSLPVSQKTLDLIQDGLRAVTEEGGTASALKSLPVDVAGKTGTAENPPWQGPWLVHCLCSGQESQPCCGLRCGAGQLWVGFSRAYCSVYLGICLYDTGCQKARQRVFER